MSLSRTRLNFLSSFLQSTFGATRARLFWRESLCVAGRKHALTISSPLPCPHLNRQVAFFCYGFEVRKEDVSWLSSFSPRGWFHTWTILEIFLLFPVVIFLPTQSCNPASKYRSSFPPFPQISFSQVTPGIAVCSLASLWRGIHTATRGFIRNFRPGLLVCLA